MSFEKAWELLKMPIVPHSVTTNEDGTDWEGKFEDPVTGEILPIIGRLDAPGATRGEAHIAPHLPSPSWMNSRASVYFDRDEFEEDISDYDTFLHPTDLGTKTAYQRRGYATALMDLIAQIVQQQHNEKMFESLAQSFDAERFVEAMSDRFAEDEKGHRYWVGRNDLMEKSWELMKAFREPSLWHGTLSENAKKILEEGFEPWTFGALEREEAERYAEDRWDDSRDSGPAILGFDVPEGMDMIDPRTEGYDFGSDFGHYIVKPPVPPEYIRPYAIGHNKMTSQEWNDFLGMLRELDSLDWFYSYTLDDEAWRRGQ